MSTRAKRFRPTPGLRKEVLACCERLKVQGYTFVRGVYADGRGQQCCALGAISICEQPLKLEKHIDLDGYLYERLETRGGCESFALSLQHLGCTAWGLESIEAGFEGWSFESIVDNSEGANSGEQVELMGRFQADAYRIGEEISKKYCCGIVL